MHKNIILIGMPGAGKSTVGIVLAKILGYSFLDSDLVIQEKKGRLLHELITEYGNEGFLDIENEINKNIRVKKTVISTGGSAVYCEEAMEHFKEEGIVVYIQLTYENIEKRLGSLKKRGVVLRQGHTLKDLYNERAPLYEKYADITVDVNEMNITDAIDAVRQSVEAALIEE